MTITVSDRPRIPRKQRKPLETGKHVPVNLAMERRIEHGRRIGLEAKYKRGEREHARVTTPEFRHGVDNMTCKVEGCRRWSYDGSSPFCPDHTR